MKLFRYIPLLTILPFLISCAKGNADISEFSVSGYAQKGQFIKGSNITAYALNEKLVAMGESFPATIKDDLGSFGISSEVSAPYLELRAEGYYFVENTGEISGAPIYLSALAASSAREVNINLFTSITGGRIRKLVNEGMTFGLAKSQAEEEVLKLFPAELGNNVTGFEEMNISEDGDANALLLAASCLIQQDRSAGEVQKLIADISSDFEADGTLSSGLLSEIYGKAQDISIPAVVRNLMEFYREKGVADFEIPQFYTILDEEYASGFHIVDIMIDVVGPDTGVEGRTKEYYAVSYEDFVLESDVDWITAEAEEICSNLYCLKIDIAPNPDIEGRTGHVYVRSTGGEILYTNTSSQAGDGQRLYVSLPSGNTKTVAGGFAEGDLINVNGKNYPLKSDDQGSTLLYVDVPESENGYGISNVPETVVAGKNGDVLCATFTYGSEVDEFKEDGEGADWRSIPCYAALKGFGSMDVPNPAAVALRTACTLLCIEFEPEVFPASTAFDRLEIDLGDSGFLSGEVTECLYPEQSQYDPSYTVPAPEYAGRSGKAVIRNVNHNNRVSFLVHPQTVRSVNMVAYDENGNRLFVLDQEMNFSLMAGYRSVLNISPTEITATIM